MRARRNSTVRRGLVRALPAGLALGLLLALASCSGGDERVGDPAPAELEEASGPWIEPSAFARRTIPRRALRLYLETGREHGLDWAVIAAVDALEQGGRSVDGGAGSSERVSAIAYTLASQGAPTDYEGALLARGGSRFSAQATRLAERLRDPEGVAALPEARPPFELPVEGLLVAGFGQAYGALHSGIDIEAPTGDPVRAIAPGVVISAGFHPAYGNRTCVLHRLLERDGSRRRITSCYGNQSRFDAEPGERVRAGAAIGRVGCSGSCLRPHTHFQILDGSGTGAPPIDPAPYMAEVDAEELDPEAALDQPR